MKNLIRGKTLLILAVAASLSVACGPSSKLTAYQQTLTDSQSLTQAKAVQTAMVASDSLLYSYQNHYLEMTELTSTFAQPIPAAQAQVTIPMQSLIDLPEGAKFGESSGRATVEAIRQGNNIVLTGRCDSVARQCAVLERKTTRQQNTIDSLSKALQYKDSELSQMAVKLNSNSVQTASAVEETRKPPRKVGGWFVAGTALGLACGAGASFLWKRYNVGSMVKRIFT